MRPSLGSPLHPLWLGASAAAIAFLTLWPNLHVATSQGVEALGALRGMLPALAGLFLAQGALALLRGPWPIRAVTLGVQAAGWYWLATIAAGRIAETRGLALFPDEAFGALFWRMPLTPLLWLLGSFGYLVLQRRLETRFDLIGRQANPPAT